MKVRKEILSATETIPGVYHANSWGEPLEKNLIDLLIEKANFNSNRKARFCLHPDPVELLQVTYLAFSRPYSDRIHRHPHRSEIIIPIHGLARHSIFDHNGRHLSNQILNGDNPIAITTQINLWHGLEVLSENFVMIEIGIGPFVPTSTVYFDEIK